MTRCLAPKEKKASLRTRRTCRLEAKAGGNCFLKGHHDSTSEKSHHWSTGRELGSTGLLLCSAAEWSLFPAIVQG